MLLETPPAASAPGRDSREPGRPWDTPAEQTLALVLITTWALATGRTLRTDVSPDRLGGDELIDFWSDPLCEEAGG
jgi:hypothetical protein